MPTRSPRRNARSKSRAGRTFYATSGGGGGGGAFDPANLAGNVLWLRGKDLGADTTSITTWTNQAAHGADAVSAGTAPTVAAASTPSNGKSARFPGAGNFVLQNIGGRGICTASSMFDTTNYRPVNAIAGTTGLANGDTWASSTLPAWWQCELPTAETITTYRILPASQYPIAWTLQGSNDGSAFTTLDTQTGQTLTSGSYSSAYTFTNSTAYKIYRLNITSANGGSIVNLGEVELGGVANSTVSTMEIWAVLKSDVSGATSQGTWHLGGDSGSGASYWPYDSSTVYEGFALDDAIGTTYNPGVSLASWRLYRIVNDGTTWQAWIDNTSKLTRASQPATWGKIPLLGKNRVGWFYKGNGAEFLVRRQKSTTQEVTDLIAYFNTEHGLTVT